MVKWVIYILFKKHFNIYYKILLMFSKTCHSVLLKKQVNPALNAGVRLIANESYRKVPIKTLTILQEKRTDDLSFKNKKSFHFDSTAREKKNTKWSLFNSAKDYKDERSKLYYGEFIKLEKKNKRAFLETVKMYKENVKNKSSHVDFIRAALKFMKEFGVEKDLDCYRAVLDVLPKDVLICTNMYMVEGMSYPRQQFVALELLDQMEEFCVMPDVEFTKLLKSIFGPMAHPTLKGCRMLYWSIKFKNKSPWLVPKKLTSDSLELAKLAITRITSVDLQTEVTTHETNIIEDSIDKTWIVNGQSPKQKKLLEKHPKDVPVIVEGGDVVWLRDKRITYFILKRDGEPLPYIFPKNVDVISNLESKYFNPNHKIEDEKASVHEQDDGVIYAVCATGTSSKDSLLSWVRILEKNGNPALANFPILFRFKQESRLPATVTEAVTTVDS